MKKRSFYMLLLLAILMLFWSNVSYAYHHTIWSWPSGPAPTGEVQLDFTGWNPYYIETAGYRVAKIDFNLINTNTKTYQDVNLVLPFVWENFTPAATPAKQASSWDDTDQEWINDYVSDANAADGNGLYVKVYSDPNSPAFSYLAMNKTDIPTTAKFDSTYEPATVMSTDSVPAWLVDSVLEPNESKNFSIYLEYERRSTQTPYLSSLWIDPYVTRVPIPGAVWLLASALVAPVGLRRFFKKS